MINYRVLSLYFSLSALLLVSITGCDQVAERKIHWFEGSIEEGFALAEAENKPVYLYWGAVWCPPCQEIKHTVFKSKQFIAQTELFVPLYLDGDTDRAQFWGDKFGVKGYPTMIVLSPAGEEVTRIPGGIDISRYNSVLALSLNEMRPTTMLVDLALTRPKDLQASDFIQLAYYSWGQDGGSLPDGTPATFFRDLSDMSPDREASARLYMEYLVALTRDDEAVPSASAYKSAYKNAYKRVSDILDSPGLTLACWESLGYYAEEIIQLDVFSESERVKLKDKWQVILLAMRADPSLSTAEQLGGWLPLLNFYFMNENETPLPEDLVGQLKQDLRAADEKTTNSFARQSVVSQINYLYQSAKLYDDARLLLLAELEKSESPYYFMSSLSSLAEDQENIEEALDWRRKAYETSMGAATRFQWGASYVRTIIRLAPEDHDLITTTAILLFDDLAGEQDVFAGRNFRVLRSLNLQLTKWQAEQEQKSLAATFQSRIQTLCEKQIAASLERDNCDSLKSGKST
jgi:thioredoxin-related protein